MPPCASFKLYFNFKNVYQIQHHTCLVVVGHTKVHQTKILFFLCPKYHGILKNLLERHNKAGPYYVSGCKKWQNMSQAAITVGLNSKDVNIIRMANLIKVWSRRNAWNMMQKHVRDPCDTL